jgi:hypothetical protein
VEAFVHLPNKNFVSKEEGKTPTRARRSRRPPGLVRRFGVFADDNKPRFRDGSRGPNRSSTAFALARKPDTRW